MTVVLRYSSLRLLDPAAGGAVGWALRCNGAYDPDATGTGDQPRYWDQWTAMYSNYVVEFAKIKAVFASASNSTTLGQAISGIDIRSTATTATGQNDYQEGRYSRWKLHSPQTGGEPNVTLTHSINLAKWFKVGRAIQRYDLQAAYNATPVNQVFFHCFTACDDPNATDPYETWCNLSIDYTITFFDPINPSLSWLASVPALYKPSREGQRLREASDTLASQKWEVIRGDRGSSGKSAVTPNPRR